MDHFQRIQAYINYILRSQTKFSIHSPFLYDLIINIFEDKTYYPGYTKIEQRKKQLAKDHRSIIRTDFGAGETRTGEPVRLSEIVSRECIRKQYGRLLYRLVRNFRPDTVLELGTSLGISASYMAGAYEGISVYTVEGCPEISAIARETFRLMNLSHIKLVQGNFNDVLPGLLESLDRLDFVFIDGNHREDAVINYFNQLLRKAKNDTIMVFDDIHWSHGMEKAWKTICAHEEVKVTIDLFQLGLVFFKKELSKQDFVIRYS